MIYVITAKASLLLLLLFAFLFVLASYFPRFFPFSSGLLKRDDNLREKWNGFRKMKARMGLKVVIKNCGKGERERETKKTF